MMRATGVIRSLAALRGPFSLGAHAVLMLLFLVSALTGLGRRAGAHSQN